MTPLILTIAITAALAFLATLTALLFGVAVGAFLQYRASHGLAPLALPSFFHKTQVITEEPKEEQVQYPVVKT